MIDRRQSVFYSVEYALKKLLDNDKFIDEYFRRSQNQISCAVERGLLSSLNTHVDTNVGGIQIYANYLNQHRAEYHHSPAFQLSSVDEIYVNNDMSNFDEKGASTSFQKISPSNAQIQTSNDISLSNDFVVEVEYNDSPTVRKATNYVNVSVSNAQTRNRFRQTIASNMSIMNTIPTLAESTYIYKRWLSGFKELYIYIPTTFTVYQQNEDGENVNKNATWICVKINKRHFNFHHIYQAHINGQSLPMQIHNDNPSITHYNDVVLPSMLRTICTSDDPRQNTTIVYDSYQAQYVLYFVCYGTDAQAIRIFGD